jgi:hypothetical protein
LHGDLHKSVLVVDLGTAVDVDEKVVSDIDLSFAFRTPHSDVYWWTETLWGGAAGSQEKDSERCGAGSQM